MSRCFKSGFVTIIGRPNVGKSTLMNQLIGQKIAITSSKAQTTTNRIQTVYTSEEGQIVFLDTVNRIRRFFPGQSKVEAGSDGIHIRVGALSAVARILLLWCKAML